MAAQSVPIKVPLIPAELQREWDIYHATWFTLMGVGGGVFLLARLLGLESRLGIWFGLPVVDLVSFVVISVGGLVLIWSLGRSLRFLRAVLKPGSSWISRGAIADFVFLVVGGVLILPALSVGGATPFARLPWDPWASDAVGKTMEILALASSAVVIVYAGLVLADKAAIPFWNSQAIPIQFMISSLATSMASIMLMQTLNGDPIGAREFQLLLAFLALLLASIIWHLTTKKSAPGKRESLERLHTKFRWSFFGGVVGAGTILPMILAVIGVASQPARDAIGIACLLCTVPGGFALRLIILRVGFFPPLSGALRLSKR